MLQIGFFSRRTMEALGAEGAANELRELAARLRAAGMGDAEAEAIGKLAERFFEALRKSVRDFTERELQTQQLRLHGEVPARERSSRRASTA